MSKESWKSWLLEEALVLLLQSLPYIGVLGILLGIPLLTWIGFGLTTVMFAIAAVVGFAGGVYLVYSIVRSLPTLSTPQRLIAVPFAVILFLCLASIVGSIIFLLVHEPA